MELTEATYSLVSLLPTCVRYNCNFHIAAQRRNVSARHMAMKVLFVASTSHWQGLDLVGSTFILSRRDERYI
jgi:hypothetical protein